MYICLQTVSALKYLNEIKPPVIHYDLKPGKASRCLSRSQLLRRNSEGDKTTEGTHSRELIDKKKKDILKLFDNYS